VHAAAMIPKSFNLLGNKKLAAVECQRLPERDAEPFASLTAITL
jgi:hypothetical protein